MSAALLMKVLMLKYLLKLSVLICSLPRIITCVCSEVRRVVRITSRKMPRENRRVLSLAKRLMRWRIPVVVWYTLVSGRWRAHSLTTIGSRGRSKGPFMAPRRLVMLLNLLIKLSTIICCLSSVVPVGMI